VTDRELDLNVSVQTGTPGKPVKKTVSVWGGGGRGGVTGGYDPYSL
jgi:hypothetical protein